MRRRDGFLLIEVLCAIAVLSAAMLAAGETLAATRLAASRRRALDAIADCAASCLAMTMIGPGASGLACGSGARAEMDSAVAGGDVEAVTWRIRSGTVGPETFETLRYAR